MNRASLATLCWFVTGLGALAQICSAEELSGRVVGISDGDTIKLLSLDKRQSVIRIGGIDAPEKRQPFGSVAKKRLSDLAYQRQVHATCHKTDRFGRKICKIRVQSEDVGLRLVRDGFAWHFKQYAQEQVPGDAELYARAEVLARQEKRGLWSERQPVPPWDWRIGFRGTVGSETR